MRPQGQATRGRGHNCQEAEASNHEAKASFWASRPELNIPDGHTH